MKNKYIDLIQQTFDFPQEEFEVLDNDLHFFGIPLMEVVKKYGTPVKIFYLPLISEQIRKTKMMFNVAMAKVDYKGTYNFCYCTKSSHFSFVLEEVLKTNSHIETSSAFDLNIIESLSTAGLFKKDKYIICNGFKRIQYLENIVNIANNDFDNIIPIIDNKEEYDYYVSHLKKGCKLGIRIAAEEQPNFEFYTSRLGIRYTDIVPFYLEKIKPKTQFQLKMLHFFINTGIQDNAYYWNELTKCVNMYCELKSACPELDSLNIGGGFPVKSSLQFDYDYEYMSEEIILQIKNTCEQNNVPEPNIFTEFGSYTVGGSSAVLYSIIGQKKQNDREVWDMIDSSFMTTLPDSWAINKRFILLPVNNWNAEYENVFLGGLTCDSEDYYNAEEHANVVFLPKIKNGNTQYIGFFNTGAYQESIGGYGGLQHCLIPAPKIVLIDRDENGEYTTKLFAKEQSYKSMLKILGYETY